MSYHGEIGWQIVISDVTAWAQLGLGFRGSGLHKSEAQALGQAEAWPGLGLGLSRGLR